MSPSVTVQSHLPAGWAEREMVGDIRRTFTHHPKVLQPKWLYDDLGSQLFHEITGLSVHAVVGDFTRHLPHLPDGDRRMVAFLGSTVGNFYREERRAFLGALADTRG